MLRKCPLVEAKETWNIENFLGPTGPRRIRRFFGTYGSISQGPPTPPPAHRGPPDFTITSYLTYGCAMKSSYRRQYNYDNALFDTITRRGYRTRKIRAT